jgi:hypothetical protein
VEYRQSKKPSEEFNHSERNKKTEGMKPPPSRRIRGNAGGYFIIRLTIDFLGGSINLHDRYKGG